MNQNSNDDDRTTIPIWRRYRYVIGFLLFSSCTTVYIGRFNLSNAIVEMARPLRTAESQINIDIAHCARSTNQSISKLLSSSSSSSSSSSLSPSSAQPDLRSAPKFDWNEKTQGLILSAFFWGYIAFMIPSGLLIQRFGARLLVSISIFATAAINAATPALAFASFTGLIVSRVALGVVQAFVFPSAYALVSRWIPENEQSSFLALSLVGGQLGSIIGFTLSGYLCQSGLAGGWPSVFYVTAAICFAVGLTFTIGVTDDPEQNLWVSRAEYDYIVQNSSTLRREKILRNIGMVNEKTTTENGAETSIAISSSSSSSSSFPWKRAFTSKPILAFIFLRFTNMIFYVLVLTKLPTYIKSVIGVSVERNGLYSVSINLVCAISMMLAGIGADHCWEKRYFLTKTMLRKTFESIATIGSSIFVCAIPLTGCSEIGFLAIMFAAQIAFGFMTGGSNAMPADMTAKFTATLFAIGNVAAMSGGVVSPYLIGAILDLDPAEPRRQWSYIFCGVAAITVTGNAIFCFFGSAEELRWEESESENESVIREKQRKVKVKAKEQESKEEEEMKPLKSNNNNNNNNNSEVSIDPTDRS